MIPTAHWSGICWRAGCTTSEARVSNFRANRRRVVLIGSMGAYRHILGVAEQLATAGVDTIVPEAEDQAVLQLSLPEFELFKRRVSFAYLKKIRDPRTFCVLAVNLDRHGILNYVGPNAFAEIAVAFAQSKKIYLLQGVPEAYEDELSAWQAVALRGDLAPLISDFRASCIVEEHPQLRLL